MKGGLQVSLKSLQRLGEEIPEEPSSTTLLIGSSTQLCETRLDRPHFLHRRKLSQEPDAEEAGSGTGQVLGPPLSQPRILTQGFVTVQFLAQNGFRFLP